MTDLLKPWTPPPVLLDGDVPMELELSPYYASDLLIYLHTHEASQIRGYVLPTLQIAEAVPDEKTVDEMVAESDGSLDRIRARRGILKGLAMELLAASILRHLDSPSRVVAWAQTRDGRPNSTAPRGYPDLATEFPGSDNALAYKILGEVSAKRIMSSDDYGKQLRSALRHAEKQVEESPGTLVYCLLINNGRISDDEALHRQYRDFLRDNGLDAKSDIRMVPFYAPDFGVMTGTLADKLTLDEMHFSSSVLSSALDAVYEAILRPTLPNEENWMIKTFLNALMECLGDHGSGLDDELGAAPSM